MAASLPAPVRELQADGRILTELNKPLIDEIGEWPNLTVKVTYVSPPANGIVYATVTGPDGTGTAIVVMDAQDHAEAVGWMSRDTVRLVGEATLIAGQPGLDLRRVR